MTISVLVNMGKAAVESYGKAREYCKKKCKRKVKEK